jgi:hypothetical protein
VTTAIKIGVVQHAVDFLDQLREYQLLQKYIVIFLMKL